MESVVSGLQRAAVAAIIAVQAVRAMEPPQPPEPPPPPPEPVLLSVAAVLPQAPPPPQAPPSRKMPATCPLPFEAPPPQQASSPSAPPQTPLAVPTAAASASSSVPRPRLNNSMLGRAHELQPVSSQPTHPQTTKTSPALQTPAPTPDVTTPDPVLQASASAPTLSPRSLEILYPRPTLPRVDFHRPKRKIPNSVYSAAGAMWHTNGKSALREAWEMSGVQTPGQWVAQPTSQPPLDAQEWTPPQPSAEEKLAEAEAFVDGLMQMDQKLSRVLDGLRGDIEGLTDSLPKLRSSWSQAQLDPPAEKFEGSMAGSDLASLFLEPSARDTARMSRQSISTRTDARPLTSQPVNPELRAAENSLRVLRAREREAVKSLQILRARQEDAMRALEQVQAETALNN